MESSCSWPPIFTLSLLSTCFCAVSSSWFVVLVCSCWAWKRIVWADMCVSHLNNRLPYAGDGSTDRPTTQDTEADCNNRMALGDSLLNLSIGSTSTSSSSPTKSSWLRSLENNQFLTQPHQRPSQPLDANSNSNHSDPSGGDKRMLKPSRLGALGNGEPLLGNSTWKYCRPVSHVHPHNSHNGNVFQLMDGLTLKEPANAQSRPPDHLNWRGSGRKKLRLPNGFDAACLKSTTKEAAHVNDAASAKDQDLEDVDCVKSYTYAGKRRLGGCNGKPTSKKSCKSYVLVVCLLASLLFNGILIALFINSKQLTN